MSKRKEYKDRYGQSDKAKQDKAASQRRVRLAKYGLNMQQWYDLSLEQGGVCAICKKPPKKRALSVDHDHTTKKIRGLLCMPCNRYKVGSLTSQSIQQLVNYLNSPPADRLFNRSHPEANPQNKTEVSGSLGIDFYFFP